MRPAPATAASRAQRTANFFHVQWTRCGNYWAGDLSELSIIGRWRTEDDSWNNMLFVAYNPSRASEFNSASAKNITMFTEFFRKDLDVAAQAKAEADQFRPNPANKSKIWTTSYDCSEMVRGSVRLCDGWDCKAIGGSNYGLCDTEDCKAIVRKDQGRCETYDCRAILSSNRKLCDSQACLAMVTKDQKWCNSDRNTNSD